MDTMATGLMGNPIDLDFAWFVPVKMITVTGALTPGETARDGPLYL